MSIQIWRYEVPVDDQWHCLDLTGDPLHVACRLRADVVEFWAQHHTEVPARERWFQVFGTGHRLPVREMGKYWGTAFALAGTAVWHLIERQQ